MGAVRRGGRVYRYVLPDGSGMQVAEEAHRRGTPAIISYGFRYPKAALARFALLLKPIRPAELLEVVAKALKP